MNMKKIILTAVAGIAGICSAATTYNLANGNVTVPANTTATITQSAFGRFSYGTKSTPYSHFATTGSAQLSLTTGLMLKAFKRSMISTTLLLRVSGQFSLNVIPRTTTVAFLGAIPASIISLIAASATNAPILSLTLRPLSMI